MRGTARSPESPPQDVRRAVRARGQEGSFSMVLSLGLGRSSPQKCRLEGQNEAAPVSISGDASEGLRGGTAGDQAVVALLCSAAQRAAVREPRVACAVGGRPCCRSVTAKTARLLLAMPVPPGRSSCRVRPSAATSSCAWTAVCECVSTQGRCVPKQARTVRVYERTHECTHARTHVRTHVRTYARTYSRSYARTNVRTNVRTSVRA